MEDINFIVNVILVSCNFKMAFIVARNYFSDKDVCREHLRELTVKLRLELVESAKQHLIICLDECQVLAIIQDEEIEMDETKKVLLESHPICRLIHNCNNVTPYYDIYFYTAADEQVCYLGVPVIAYKKLEASVVASKLKDHETMLGGKISIKHRLRTQTSVGDVVNGFPPSKVAFLL